MIKLSGLNFWEIWECEYELGITWWQEIVINCIGYKNGILVSLEIVHVFLKGIQKYTGVKGHNFGILFNIM